MTKDHISKLSLRPPSAQQPSTGILQSSGHRVSNDQQFSQQYLAFFRLCFFNRSPFPQVLQLQLMQLLQHLISPFDVAELTGTALGSRASEQSGYLFQSGLPVLPPRLPPRPSAKPTGFASCSTNCARR